MSKHILCTLAHASTLINGVAFAASDNPAGMLSVDPVDDETAANFTSIPGYEIHEVKGKASEPKAPAKAPAAKTLTKAEKAAAKKAEKAAAEAAPPVATAPAAPAAPAATEPPATDGEPAATDPETTEDEQPSETSEQPDSESADA